MGRQPRPSPKASSKQPKQTKNSDSIVQAPKPVRGELFMSDLSDNTPHMMNVPSDDDEPPQFGKKDVGDDLEFTKKQASQMY
jgi:hypothetical protein